MSVNVIKYMIVRIFPSISYGGSTGLPPIHVRRMRVMPISHVSNWLGVLKFEPCCKGFIIGNR